MVLRKTPGERAPTVATLPPNTAIVIEKEDGRWLRVRAGKHVGYLTRTTVTDISLTLPVAPEPTPTPDLVAADPIERPAERARWGADRVAATKVGGSGLFVDVTVATASLFAEPRAGAAKVADVARGAKLAVIENANASAAWIHVRDDAGNEAWISRADIDNTTTAAVAISGSLEPQGPTTVGTIDPIVRAATGRVRITAGAAIGYRSLGMDFTSNGAVGLANYVVSADTPAADLGVDVVMRVSKLRVGFDGRVQLGTSSPGSGIEYTGPTRAGGNISFSTVAADAGARVSIQTGRAFELGVRAGFHYDAFMASDVANAGRLPREHLIGATVGARVEIVPPRSRVHVGLRVDALAIGKRSQTVGLEDGTSSDAGAVWAGATIRIAIRRHLSLLSGYDFGRATTTWSGMSVRFSGVTEARRVDSTQTVQIGLAAEL